MVSSLALIVLNLNNSQLYVILLLVTWVPIHLCEMFLVFCFGTLHAHRVQNTCVLLFQLRVEELHFYRVEV